MKKDMVNIKVRISDYKSKDAAIKDMDECYNAVKKKYLKAFWNK